MTQPPSISSIISDHGDTRFFLNTQKGNQSGALAWYDKALAAGWEPQEGILNVMQVRYMT